MPDWFHVTRSESGLALDVRPPLKRKWRALIPWHDIQRVCLKVEGFLGSASLYIFVNGRPESYAIPLESDGGETLVD